MEGINNVPEITRWDDIDDVMPGQTSPVMLMTPTSEMFEEISTYFEDSQGMPGNSSEAPPFTPAESESIEPPAITKVRVSRSHRYRRSRQSDTTASGESGAESASSVYRPVRASATYRNLKGRKKWAFQAIRAPFLEGNSFNTTLPPFKRGTFCSTIQEEAKLKTYAVGGFLKCIRLWHRVNQKRRVKESYLPAVYMDTDEPLSPLSEGNETSDDDGIKIMGNDIFVKSRKKMCPGKQGGMPSSSQTKNQDHVKTVTQMSKKAKGNGSLPVNNGSTSNHAKAGCRPVVVPGCHAMTRRERHRAKGVRGIDPGPVDETACDGKDGPSAPPHPSQPEEEEASVASTPPEDPSVTVSAGVGSTLEKSGDLVLRRDPSSDATPVQQVNPPPEMPRPGEPISAGNRQPGVARENVCRSPDVSEMVRTSKSKKMFLESGEVAAASGTAEASQPKSGSTVSNQSLTALLVQLEDVWETRKSSKKKKNPKTIGDITKGEGNVGDTVFAHKATTKKKAKRKRDKMASYQEDPETNSEAGNPELEKAFSHPADREDGLERDASETSDVSQRTLDNDNVDVVHKPRKKNREKKRGVTEVGGKDLRLDGPCPAVVTADVSQRVSVSAISTVNHDDDNEGLRNRKRRKKEKKCKVAEEGEINMTLDGPLPVLEFSDVSQPTPGSAITIYNNNNDDDDDNNEEHRKRKKRKKENKVKVAAGEEITMSLDRPVVEPSSVTQRTSESTINNHNTDDSLDVSGEVLLKPRKESKKKKRRTHGVVTVEEVNVAETSQYPSCEDILVEGSGLTSACDQKRKRHHSFLSDDMAENHLNAKTKSPASFENGRQKLKSKDDQISTCEAEAEPVENGGTPMDSLTGPSEMVKTKKKKKNKERDASRERVVEDDEVQEGSALDARSSTEPGHEIVKKKKKKKKDKEADRESEAHLLVERETPDDIEATALMMKKKKKCKENTRPEHSGEPMPTDSVTVSPQPCSPALDTEATQGGNAANPNDGGPADPTAERKRMRKKKKSVIAACDPVPEQDMIPTSEPLQQRTGETELFLKKKKKKKNKNEDSRATEWIEAETDPGAKEAQRWSHEAEVTSPDLAPPESPTCTYDEPRSAGHVKKKKHKMKDLS